MTYAHMTRSRLLIAQVGQYTEKHLQVFIGHTAAQAVLAKLKLPFISLGGTGIALPSSDPTCIVVSDDSGVQREHHGTSLGAVVLVDLERPASHAHADASMDVDTVDAVDAAENDGLSDLSAHDSSQQSSYRRSSTSRTNFSKSSSSSTTPRLNPALVRLRHPLADVTEGCPDTRFDHASNIRHVSSNSQHVFEQNESQQSQHEPDISGEGTLICADDISAIQKANHRRWSTAALKNLEQQDYANMPHEQCALVASKASKALLQMSCRQQDLNKQIRALKRTNQRQTSQLEKKQKLLDAHSAKTGLEIVPIGRTGKRMSLQSGFAIGIRRNLSNIAATDFGATVLQDLSHQRVCRAEVRTGAAILCRMREECTTVIHAEPTTSWQLSTVSFRCDATNSSIRRREKLHVLDVDFAWVKDHAALKRYDVDNAFAFRRCLYPCCRFYQRVSCAMCIMPACWVLAVVWFWWLVRFGFGYCCLGSGGKEARVTEVRHPGCDRKGC